MFSFQLITPDGVRWWSSEPLGSRKEFKRRVAEQAIEIEQRTDCGRLPIRFNGTRAVVGPYQFRMVFAGILVEPSLN